MVDASPNSDFRISRVSFCRVNAGAISTMLFPKMNWGFVLSLLLGYALVVATNLAVLIDGYAVFD